MSKPTLLLAVLLGLMLAYTAWLHPAERFGLYHDDTLYFTSAQALATGQGYILPSLPGQPRQSKYPVLYSWLLSWIWRWNPSFPVNVLPAAWLSALFGCVYLVAAYWLLGGLGGFGPAPSLAIVALCAFHPVFLYLAGAVLSDMLFSALALGAMAAAQLALEEHPRLAALVAAGLLAGLATATRTLGVAVIAGMVAIALYRRLWHRALAIAALAAPFVLLAVAFRAAQTAPDGPPGWRQNWLYYTSYGQFWKVCVPNFQVLQDMVAANIRYWLEGIPGNTLFPTLGEGSSMAGGMLQITLAVAILSGVVRQARQHGWKPVHAAFALYSAGTWLWNYALMDRFLLPFLPLLYAGLWTEAKHMAAVLRRSTRSGAEKAIAGVLALGLAAIGILAVREYAFGYRTQLRDLGPRRAQLGREKQEAYDWIRARTAPATRLIAYEDAALYLYTGRQSVRPVAFSTEAFYRKDESILARDLDRIFDTPKAIQARYWLMSDDDFRLETGTPRIRERIASIQATLPVVFQSSGGRVRIYELLK